MEREWYIEYLPAPTKKEKHPKWYRPVNLKMRKWPSGDLEWVDIQPVTLERCVEWIGQYDESHRERMRFVHKDGDLIPGAAIVGFDRIGNRYRSPRGDGHGS